MIAPSLIKVPGLTTAFAITQVPFSMVLNLLIVDLGCIRLTILTFSFLRYDIFLYLNSLSPIATKKAS